MDVRFWNTRPMARQRGAAAIMAMMFLVIFGSLAAAMAIVSQGNLHTADTHLKVNRSLVSAESGLRVGAFLIHKAILGDLNEPGVRTERGIINRDEAERLWGEICDYWHEHAQGFPSVTVPHAWEFEGVRIEASMPVVDLIIYPIYPESDREPTLLHVTATSVEGAGQRAISRTVSMSYAMDKGIASRYAILSRSRVMIGRNVSIEGPVGSSFKDVHLRNGHPIQMVSDFRGLDDQLDGYLNQLRDRLKSRDVAGDLLNADNRLPVRSGADTDLAALDFNGDGYLTDFDLFMHRYADQNGTVDRAGLASKLQSYGGWSDADATIIARQMVDLMDRRGTSGESPDGVLSREDAYVKITGEVRIDARLENWQGSGAAGASYRDYFEGTIREGHNENPLTFDAGNGQDFVFDKDAWNASNPYQAEGGSDPNSVLGEPNGGYVIEAVPFGSTHPYDYYRRPVYRGRTFTNLVIPEGTNALFENCVFIGTTYVKTEKNNTHANFIYSGMADSGGSMLFQGSDAWRNDIGRGNVTSKQLANNLRFHSCQFQGAVVSDAPRAYTHTRNKLTFTGNTVFLDVTDEQQTPTLSDEERLLFERSNMIVPEMSVELGDLSSPENGKVNLAGTIIAGLIDIRGEAEIDGSLLTTFEPQAGIAPALGQTSPNFNTTLGYFTRGEGDLEAGEDLPAGGWGMIRIRRNMNRPMPDGVSTRIGIVPVWDTYHEGVRP